MEYMEYLNDIVQTISDPENQFVNPDDESESKTFNEIILNRGIIETPQKQSARYFNKDMEIRTARDLVTVIQEVIILNKSNIGKEGVIIKNIDSGEFDTKSNKFVEYLTNNAESSNFELLEMGMADENGQEYIELCIEALHKYKYLTEAIHNMDKNKEPTQRHDVSKYNKDIVELIEELKKPAIMPPPIPMPVVPGQPPQMPQQQQASIDLNSINSKVDIINSEMSGLLEIANSLETTNALNRVSIKKDYERIIQQLQKIKLGDKKAHDDVCDGSIWPYQEFIIDLYLNSPINSNDPAVLRDFITNFKNLNSILTTKINTLSNKPKALDKDAKVAFIKYVTSVNDYFNILKDAITNYGKIQIDVKLNSNISYWHAYSDSKQEPSGIIVFRTKEEGFMWNSDVPRADEENRQLEMIKANSGNGN